MDEKLILLMGGILSVLGIVSIGNYLNKLNNFLWEGYAISIFFVLSLWVFFLFMYMFIAK